MFIVTASEFKERINIVADVMSEQTSLKDIDLANYNLLLEVSELYESIELLINNQHNTTLPALARILFERYIYIMFLNKSKNYANDRAKKYLDYSEYEIQKYHEFVYLNDTKETSYSDIRNYIGINQNDNKFSQAFNMNNLTMKKNKFRNGFTNINNKNFKWYSQTDEYETDDKGNNVPIELYNFKDLCYHLGFPVYYHICYKNFSSNIHGSASLRSVIEDSLYEKPNNVDLSISIVAFVINRLSDMFQ
ncbi:DUF5677 domain-containing protein [Staphylococcus saprophyticus]|jgi:hypothetical protein|uniref:DUF5677 domain-containing protein n=1 Tax=Staphylococcus saprophyticus TaxID=29385 RepID=UPI001642BE61|nr:DUF5677 domain-containing protein [Staphylococcus saprophyticus]MBC2921938.1 hypothetical protein [Staphylococcus saprophyticus]MBC2958539.1 hypothetical protein [Staphylococcus saprophyticus]MBC3010378.1 hypothetical protein [Staphylococcus saprophyticus]MBC3024257.1 hypothetical protein [Staphylococcus saprophyticus]MBC3031484.1 hypothetical protein [Staphylococcus saprophyticus]